MGIAVAIPKLTTNEIEALYGVMGGGVESHREAGFYRVADWYDAVGELLALELERRADGGAMLDHHRYTRLQRTTELLAMDEIKGTGMAMYFSLSGVPVSPWGDFFHALIGLLHDVGTTRELMH